MQGDLMILLTIVEGDTELLDGFPETISFETDIPATVFYTLDGTTPTENSLIAIGKVFLPTLSGTLQVKAIAISGDDSSDVVSVKYENESTTLGGPRILGEEGIVVMGYGDEAVSSLGYTADGEAALKTSRDVNDLSLKGSKTDSIGVEIGGGKTSYSFVNFSLKNEPSLPKETSTPNSNPNFDPSAKFIIIDGSTDEARDNQVVKIVNRPYNTFGTTTNFYKERLGEKEPIITGNYVRSFYNRETGKYVSYYWESLESRWIRSEQTISKKTLKIGPRSVKRFVYRWIQDRALSQLF
jgi:hypothetical protein